MSGLIKIGKDLIPVIAITKIQIDGCHLRLTTIERNYGVDFENEDAVKIAVEQIFGKTYDFGFI